MRGMIGVALTLLVATVLACPLVVGVAVSRR